MRTIRSLILFLLVLPFGFAQAQDDASSNQMTLEQCIEYALKTNANMINAQIDIKTAEATVGEVRAQGLPQLNGQFQYTYNYRIQTQLFPASNFDQNAGDDEIVNFQFGLPYNGTAGVTLNQLLFDGTYFLGLRAAETYTDLSKKAIKVTEAEVKANISKVYYGVLVTKERQKIIGENVKRIEALLKETKILYENGFVEELDVTKLEVTYNNLKNEQTRLDRFVENNLNLLKFQMGMPVQEELNLTATIAQVQMNMTALEEETVDYAARPEFSTLR